MRIRQRKATHGISGANRISGWTGIVESVDVMAANVSDVSEMAKLLTGDEKPVNGDSGYLRATKRPDAVIRNKKGKKIKYTKSSRRYYRRL